MIWSLICFLLVLPHDFYVTITDILYNDERQALEVTIKFTTHDLEEVIEAQSHAPLNLGTQYESDSADYYLADYIQHLFTLSSDRVLSLNFIGKDVEYEDTWAFLEVNDISMPDTLTIKNTLLIDLFPLQENWVYLKVGDHIQSGICTKNNTELRLPYKE